MRLTLLIRISAVKSVECKARCILQVVAIYDGFACATYCQVQRNCTEMKVSATAKAHERHYWRIGASMPTPALFIIKLTTHHYAASHAVYM